MAETHYVTGRRIREPFERDGLSSAVFGMGCFWGAEKDFWERPQVWSTTVGYAGGFTPYPSYSSFAPDHPACPVRPEQVCS